jgi:hypothetical protein
MESAGTPFGIAQSKFQIENLRPAICNSERSEDEGGLQATDPLTALGRARLGRIDVRCPHTNELLNSLEFELCLIAGK